ncbi:MAG TPA: DUF4129 domain-containing protein, partial [Solirubrobacteraceae bacterium]|nr:DUF4129 domain-containing protein [Solirubrobacteraceae bacterium]
ERVLARPEYEQPGPSLLERAVDWVLDRLPDIGNRRLSGPDVDPGGGFVTSAFGWLIAIALVALIAWLLVRAFRGYERSAGDDGDAAEGDDEPARPAQAWHAEADAHEREGRWREAVRCRYRAVVAELAGRGLVQEVPGRTAGDYELEIVRRAPGAGSAFSEVTRLFQAAWYGGRPTGADDARRARALAADTVAAAGSA